MENPEEIFEKHIKNLSISDQLEILILIAQKLRMPYENKARVIHANNPEELKKWKEEIEKNQPPFEDWDDEP